MTPDLDGMQHVHFVGISGAGMSALARLLLARGVTVSGSDRSPGEQGDDLSRLGAKVSTGHAAENIQNPDLVVVSSAVHSDNPEVQAAGTRDIPVIKRSEFLGMIFNAGRGIAVAGTHGKTTTSALIGHVLTETGRDPTVLIGGISKNLGSNARVGGDIVVAEADEYDASFLFLRPAIGVITNVAREHLDFYGSAEGIEAAFSQFARTVSETLVVCADDPAALRVASGAPARTITYGLAAADWQASDVRDEAGMLRFVAEGHGERLECATHLAGIHNVRNALAAIAVCTVLGIPGNEVMRAVAGFAGVARRFDVRGEAANVMVIDDYAVHPTEIRATLAAMKTRFHRPIRAIFQPHTYSRTRDFLDDFSVSFADAGAVYLMNIYAARETETLGISEPVVAHALSRHHPCVHYTGTADATVDAIIHAARRGDLIATLGAGDVTSLGPEILRRLSTG